MRAAINVCTIVALLMTTCLVSTCLPGWRYKDFPNKHRPADK